VNLTYSGILRAKCTSRSTFPTALQIWLLQRHMLLPSPEQRTDYFQYTIHGGAFSARWLS